MSSYDPTDIRSQERAKSEQDQRDKLTRETEAADFKWIMGSKRGRRILFGIVNRSCVGNSCFNTNAITMSFVSGRQLEGERIETMAKDLCPELYLLMLKESKADKPEQMND